MSTPPTTLRLSSELTIQTAAANKDALLEAFGRRADFDIDLAETTEIDTAGLQLLLLAKREAAHLGVRLRLLSMGQCVLDVLEVAGLDANLNDIQTGGATSAASPGDRSTA